MGMRMPKTCWAVFKWQVINLRICCIWLVDSVENTTAYLWTNVHFLWDFPRKNLGHEFLSSKNEPMSRFRGYPEVDGNMLSLARQISGHRPKLSQGHLPHILPISFSLILPFKATHSKLITPSFSKQLIIIIIIIYLTANGLSPGGSSYNACT